MNRSRKLTTKVGAKKKPKMARRVTFKDVADAVEDQLEKGSAKRGKDSKKKGKGKGKSKGKNERKPQSNLRRQSKRIGRNLETKSNKSNKSGKKGKNGEKKKVLEEAEVEIPKPKLATPSLLIPEKESDHTKLLIALLFNKLKNYPGAFNALGKFGQILQKNSIDPTKVLLTNNIDEETMSKLQYDINDTRV